MDMNMRRSGLAASLALFVFAAAGIHAAPLPPEITIGAVETLTGDNSAYGVSIRNGLELALSEINTGNFLGAAIGAAILMPCAARLSGRRARIPSPGRPNCSRAPCR